MMERYVRVKVRYGLIQVWEDGELIGTLRSTQGEWSAFSHRTGMRVKSQSKDSGNWRTLDEAEAAIKREVPEDA